MDNQPGTIGALGNADAVAKSSSIGATISNSVLYLQTADATSVGLVGTSSQTFNGVKTFQSGAAIQLSGSNFFNTNNGGVITMNVVNQATNIGSTTRTRISLNSGSGAGTLRTGLEANSLGQFSIFTQNAGNTASLFLDAISLNTTNIINGGGGTGSVALRLDNNNNSGSLVLVGDSSSNFSSLTTNHIAGYNAGIVISAGNQGSQTVFVKGNIQVQNGKSINTANGRTGILFTEGNTSNQVILSIGAQPTMPTGQVYGLIHNLPVTPVVTSTLASGFLVNGTMSSTTASQTLIGMRVAPNFTATHSNVTTTTFETVVGGNSGTASFRLSNNYRLSLASGTNRTSGTASLDGANPGTATINNTLVTANTIIICTKQNAAIVNSVVVTSRTPGTSFTVTSTHNNNDSDVFGYVLIEPM